MNKEKMAIWNHGLDRGQKEFGWLSEEVREKTYAQYTRCQVALEDDTPVDEFKIICKMWWEALKRA